MELNVLMGHAPARVDDKGRLKIPADFRKLIEEKYGPDCFITSIDGERAMVYPLPVWYDFQGRLTKVPSTSMAKSKLLERMNYFGQVSTIDKQGRVLVPQILRDSAKLPADVVVTGNIDHLVVSDRAALAKRLASEDFTPEDYDELSKLLS